MIEGTYRAYACDERRGLVQCFVTQFCDRGRRHRASRARRSRVRKCNRKRGCACLLEAHSGCVVTQQKNITIEMPTRYYIVMLMILRVSILTRCSCDLIIAIITITIMTKYKINLDVFFVEIIPQSRPHPSLLCRRGRNLVQDGTQNRSCS